MFATKFRSALLLSSLLLIQPATAQNLPGTAIDEAAVSADVKALFTLAAQAYPTMFVGGSGWRSYSGYTFKYFSSSGIYVGIKDGQVNLLGGPFGNTITPKGSVAQVTTALQSYIAKLNTTPTADFSGFIAARTLGDLVRYFSSLTMEYTSSSIFGVATAQIKIEVLGQETVGGVAADTLRVTISGNGAPNPVSYDMAVDSSGTVQRLSMGGFQYTAAQAQQLGTGIVSSFLIALVAGDNAQVKAALSGELQSPALSTKVTQRIVGNTTLPTIQITVEAGGSNITSYISDFGNFTMMTRYSASIAGMTSGFEIIDMKLR